MDIDCKPDITRDTFHPLRHFTRVIMQQGRVQLDADWNEQVDILLHYLRTFIADMIGPCGGPNGSFTVAQPTNQPAPYQLTIQSGHYYVDGILCENERSDYTYSIPASLRPGSDQSQKTETYFIYLDVWEREVTYLEDQFIREIALGGADTTTRSEVVWRIRAKNASEINNLSDPSSKREWTELVAKWQNDNYGHLQARLADSEQSPKEPCAIPPSSQYRGMENQLYRIEIHDGGTSETATFKWSRENGAVVFPIVGSITGGSDQTSLTLRLGNLGRDNSRFGLSNNDWVEIVAIEDELEGKPGALMYVQSIEYASRQVTLASKSKSGVTIPEHALFLRRWDYDYLASDPNDKRVPQIVDSGALQIVANQPLPLENGIEVLFYEDEKNGKSSSPTYRTGDYWLIPARTATGSIEWPQKNNKPETLPPHGVKHHYAPLAYVVLDAQGNVEKNQPYDLRSTINQLGGS